jgi:hypothetical protein
MKRRRLASRAPYRLFIPHALSRAVPPREAWIVRDLTMPPRDWSAYDVPTRARRLLSHQVNR